MNLHTCIIDIKTLVCSPRAQSLYLQLSTQQRLSWGRSPGPVPLPSARLPDYREGALQYSIPLAVAQLHSATTRGRSRTGPNAAHGHGLRPASERCGNVDLLALSLEHFVHSQYPRCWFLIHEGEAR